MKILKSLKRLVNLLEIRRKHSKLNNPFLDLSNDFNCIFIHIPKCAGWSISEAIYGKQITHKQFLTYKYYDSHLFDKYFVFSIVRDPVERFISAYNFLKSGGINEHDLNWSKLYLSEFDSINRFIKELAMNREFLNLVDGKEHFKRQSFFLEDENGIIDKNIFLMPFDKINKLPEILKSKLGITINLQHLNKTKYTDISDLLTEDSLKFLNQYYMDDLHLYKRVCRDFNS